MPFNEWNKHKLKKEYYDLKQEQLLRAVVRSALVCRRDETEQIMKRMRSDLEELETVFDRLMGRSSREAGKKNEPNNNGGEPLSQLWQIIQDLLELNNQLKELTNDEEQVLREINMEGERTAEEVEEVSQRLAEIESGCTRGDDF